MMATIAMVCDHRWMLARIELRFQDGPWIADAATHDCRVPHSRRGVFYCTRCVKWDTAPVPEGIFE